MTTPPARRPPRGAQATWLYAILRARRPPALEPPLEGLPGSGPPRALAVTEGIWAIVADAPLARYDAAAIERGLRDLEWVSACAVGHERMVARLLGSGDLVPMTLFTLFASDERALASLRRRLRGIRRALDRVRGREEWGLRLSLDERAARAAATRAEGGSGTAFLKRKRDELAAVRRAGARAGTEASRVFRALSRHATAARRRPPARTGPGVRLVLDAAFLVPRARRAAFRAAARQAAERLREQGLELSLSGPWPAYNFVGGRR